MVVNELFQYAFIFVHTILRISGCQPTYSADLGRKDLSSHCALQESQTFSHKLSHSIRNQINPKETCMCNQYSCRLCVHSTIKNNQL